MDIMTTGGHGLTMRYHFLFLVTLVLVNGYAVADEPDETQAGPQWRVDFFDDFDTFDPDNWQDQILWVNDEDQCYVWDNAFNTREVSDGTLKLRLSRSTHRDPVTTSTNTVSNTLKRAMLRAESPPRTGRSLRRAAGPPD